MRKFALLLFMLLIPFLSFAQKKTSKQLMADIRAEYNAAQELVKKLQSDIPEARPGHIVISSSENVAGIGVQDKKLECFFESDWAPITDDSEEMFWGQDLRFVRYSYNVAARKIYWEFLFNDEGTAIFVYYKGDEFFEGFTEARGYISEGMIVEMRTLENGEKETKTYEDLGEAWWTLEAVRTASEVKEVFDRYVSIGLRD